MSAKRYAPLFNAKFGSFWWYSNNTQLLMRHVSVDKVNELQVQNNKS